MANAQNSVNEPVSSERSLNGKTVVIVGGGLSGALLALKLHQRCPAARIVIIEPKRKLGCGVAYGACAPYHLLNVPVTRMEVGLTPGFAEWLADRREELAEALVESKLELAAAFVPRYLFGEYISTRIGAVLDNRSLHGIGCIRSEAVRLLNRDRGVLLIDGRRIKADVVVLAMGNLPPRPPPGPDTWLYDSGFFIPDPWATDAFAEIDADEPLLLIGTGLTTVDVSLRLNRAGHRGKLLAISRRGLTPRTHASGGAWPEFLQGKIPASPRTLTKILRAQVALAAERGIPWQRVFDTARPTVPGIWSSWNESQRRQFLRHLRARWDVHRHRMAPRVNEAFDKLRAQGALEVLAARVVAYKPRGRCVEATLRQPSGALRTFDAARVINCTGPGGEFDKIMVPLIAELREKKLAQPDALGVGIETLDCAVINAQGEASSWLYALGSLTRPAWWEITAVPEINLQVDRLVARLASTDLLGRLRPADFMDLGGGI